MMGFQDAPARLFYDFCLDEHVPSDHMLRGIDRHLDLADLRRSLKPFYSQMGRPSVDPGLMMRMLIVGYCMGIRSERRLCEEVHLNLAYRWFCRLGLDGKVPDHSTFSKNRHGRFRESDALRHLFEGVVQRCMAEGLVGAEGFASTRASSPPTPTSSARFQARTGDPRSLRKMRFAPRANISPRSTTQRSAPPRLSRRSSFPDPIRRRSGPHKGHAFFAYAANYLIDTDHGVIVDVEATRAIR
jgi:transposase